jgi:hypothetical protein
MKPMVGVRSRFAWYVFVKERVERWSWGDAVFNVVVEVLRRFEWRVFPEF